jgi:hypothetical protein
VAVQEVLPLQALPQVRLAHQAKVTLAVAAQDMAVQTMPVVVVAVLVQSVVDHLLAHLVAVVAQVVQIVLQDLL